MSFPISTSSLCRRGAPALLLALATFACGSAGRYIATVDSIDAMGISGLRLCFAVEPNNPEGVWWWHPGQSGCSTRSSSLMQGHRAKVMPQASGTIEASLQVPMKIGEPRQVELLFSAGTVRASATGASVETERLKELDVPEKL
jgi:hypothetical protein